MVLPPQSVHRRGGLSDKQWQIIQPLLPPQKPVVGRPSVDHRRVIDDILWILRTGAPWRDLPECYGQWETVSGRFYRWTGNGQWEKIFRHLQKLADAKGEINWDIHHVDGSVIRAHQHAAGAKRGV
jgi:transposase